VTAVQFKRYARPTQLFSIRRGLCVAASIAQPTAKNQRHRSEASDLRRGHWVRHVTIQLSSWPGLTP
jgi:hypothetical protein